LLRLHPDSIWVHADTIWMHADTIWVHPDTIWMHPGTIWIHPDTIWMRLDIIWVHPDTIWIHLDIIWVFRIGAGKTKMITALDFIIPMIINTVFGDKKTTTGIAIIMRGLCKIYRGMKK